MGQRLHPLAVATAERPFGASAAESTMLLGGDAATAADAPYHTPSLPCASGASGRGGALGAAVVASAQPSYLDHEALAQHRTHADGAHRAVGKRTDGVRRHDDEGAVVARPEPDERHRCRQGAGRTATGGR